MSAPGDGGGYGQALYSATGGYTYDIGGADIDLETDDNFLGDAYSFIPTASGTFCCTLTSGSALQFPVNAGQQYWMKVKSIQHTGNTVGSVTVFA